VSDKNNTVVAVLIIAAVVTAAILAIEMVGCGTVNLAVCNFGG
jgi:hypothetical protein